MGIRPRVVCPHKFCFLCRSSANRRPENPAGYASVAVGGSSAPLNPQVRLLTPDFQGVLRFGVITSRQLANRISLTSHGTVFMHRHFNTSLIFPRHALNFTSENICKWAYENLELFYRWLRPHGGKSRLMDKELKKGAALLVFLPFDPLAESQPQIDEVADIALQYHNCNRIPTLSPSLEAMGIRTSPEYSAFQSSRFLCCNTVVIPQWHSVSRKHNVCELCINHSLSIQPTKLEAGHCQFQEMGAALDSFYLREHTFTRFMSPNVECSNIHDLHNPFRYYSACCKTVNTSLANNTAFLHPSAIWRHGYITFSQVKEAHKDPQNIVPHIEDDIYLPFRTTSVTGLKCITNKTLHFYLLDSYLHWTFAVRLGASENETMKKFVTIVNLPEEIHHVLDQKEAIKKNPLEAFIHNYSIPYSPLKRHLVGDTNSETLRDTLIKEVTTKTFNDTVMDPEKLKSADLRPGNSICLLKIARHIVLCKRGLSLRINAAKNDLPWEYMVDRFPTILFFPSDRKHLSVKFPDAPINLPNLVRFVIRYSSRRSSSEVHGQAAPNPPTKAGSLQAQMVLLENDVHKLRREVHTLQLAKDQLSRQLSEVRHEKRQLTIHAHTLEKRNTELQLQGNELEKLYEQKKQELDDTVEKLQELADASENLLTENTLLKILMASMKEERKAALTETSSSSDEHLLEKSDSQREEL
ncbi:TXD11 protein, partial [Polypterus senegalus]